MEPSVTVIFLFSDIEGSTARWEARPSEMQRALRRHDDILRSTMQAHGGRVFKTIGDAFCVAFAQAVPALQAAVGAQRAIASEDWSSVDGLRVRMAVHAGEAEERDGDYFGRPVNRVARLLSSAHGGQIVVSGAVADLIGPGAPADLSLRPLGTFHLKDLEGPERIFQLCAPDLPSRFKALRTLEAAPNNLPRQTSTFVGRQDDVARIARLLAQGTLVTIAGAGGAGKTRVALECAADTIDRMEDGVWFVNLAPIVNPSLLVTTVLGTLGAAASGSGDPLGILIDYLKTRELLLVFDNCEHLVAPVAELVSAIREECARVTVLATSREGLHLPGEQIYRLPPLETADSVRLFEQRARAASARFAVTSENAALVEQICRRLDGIPLAIELAAARTPSISLAELSSRLSERFRILTGASRAAVPRQQTLRALIDWSFDLLSDSEKTLLRRLAAFNGTFSLEAAGAVCSDERLDEWSILDLLSNLTDKSLVVADVADRGQRYHLLESIREYAQQKLGDAGEAEPLRERHARFFAGLAKEAYAQFDTGPPDGWLERLAPDLDNIRAALQWSLGDGRDLPLGARLAGDAGPIFLRMSLLAEGIAWCIAAREQRAADAAHEARIEYVLSMLYNNQASFALALVCAERAAELYASSSDERGLTRALSQVAQQYARAGLYAKAKPIADRAIERASASGDARLLAGVLRRCASALPPAEIEQARRQFASAVKTLRALHDDQEACLVLEWWAEAEAGAECFEAAISLAQEALGYADRDTRMYLCGNIAGYSLALGDVAGAAPFANEALEIALEARHTLAVAIGLAYAAGVRAREQPRECAAVFGYARSQMAQLQWEGDPADRRAHETIVRELRLRLAPDEFEQLVREGAEFGQAEALAALGR